MSRIYENNIYDIHLNQISGNINNKISCHIITDELFHIKTYTNLINLNIDGYKKKIKKYNNYNNYK